MLKLRPGDTDPRTSVPKKVGKIEGTVSYEVSGSLPH
jgi:hypothetical protein